MTERKHRPGGHFRSLLRSRKNNEAASRAQEEINVFEIEGNRSIGEPSEAFFPVRREIVVFETPKSFRPLSPLRFQLERLFSRN